MFCNNDILTCIVQHSELKRQLQALEARLASLTGEDQEATVEELAQCRHLLKALSSTTQSGAAAEDEERSPAPQAQPAVALQAVHHDGVVSHDNVAASNAPLLLGPP